MNATAETVGGFVPLRAETGEEARLVMQELWLVGQILPAGARLMARHTFKSAERKPLEVVYAFALPRDAALRRFRVTGQSFSARSELRRVEEAQRIYEEGIDKGRLSAMAKLYRDGMVNLNLGNVRPDEEVCVWLELVAGVEPRDDGFRFRFPFTLALRYHRQARASEIEPGVGEMELPEEEFGDLLLPPWSRDAWALHRIGFHLSVHVPGGVAEVSSPSHPLRVQIKGESEARVQLGAGPDVPNRDLILDARSRSHAVSVFSGRDKEGRGRFAALVPSGQFGKAAGGPRRIVFVLDRSGSMEGAPIQQARKSLEACLGGLAERDLFGIVVFDSHVERFETRLTPGTQEQRAKAKEFLERIGARGGTELLAGYQAGADILGQDGGDLLLVTDGQVSAGDEIIQAAKGRAIRVHCLGIGSASEDRFLSQLARQTGGASRSLSPRERVDMGALELFAAIRRPAATDVQAAIEGLSEARIEPAPSQVVYEGTPLVVFGSAREAGEGRLQLSWRQENETRRFETPLPVGDGILGQTLKLLQGARLITEAEVEEPAAEESGAARKRRGERLERRLEALSREYGLASRAMALVAVIERPGDRAGEVPETRVVRVGMPEDVEFSSYFGTAPPAAASIPGALRAGLFRVASLGAPPDRALGTGREMARFHACEHAEREPPAAAPRGERAEFGLLPSERSEPLPCFAESASQAIEDVLIELAGLLESDGGLPGGDLEQRVAATLVAFLFFAEENRASGVAIFALHMRRMEEFLRGVDPLRLGKDKPDAIAQALQLVQEGVAARGPWEKHIRRYLDRGAMAWKDAWKDIQSALASPR